MGDGSLLPYLLLTACFLLAAYFSASETAFSGVSKVKLKNKADAGDRRAVTALEIHGNFEKALSTVLVGTNIATITISSVTTSVVTDKWGTRWVTLSTFAVTVLVLLFSEMIPKKYANVKSEKVTLAFASSLKGIMVILTPITVVFSGLAGLFSRLFSGKEEPTVTEDELYDIIEDIKDSGALPEEKGKLISSALEFSDISAGDIFTSRVDVIAIDKADPCEEIVRTIKNCAHSRLPVYDGDIDNIVGILQIRKYLREYLEKGEKTRLDELMDPVYFFPRSIAVQDLLDSMSRKKTNLAVVTDDYGGTLGIITVEDILEELVGEIFDEDDNVGEDFLPSGERCFDISGDIGVANAFDLMGYEDYDIEEVGHGSLSTWAMEMFGRLPRQGAVFTYRGVSVEALRISRQRIVKLRISLMPSEKGAEKNE